MKRITKYDPAKTYMYPNGTLATPASVAGKFPAVSVFTHVIETDEAEQVMFAMQNLAAMRSLHGIDPSLSEADAIAVLEEIVNRPPPEPEVSADERIAAALEFSNLLNM